MRSLPDFLKSLRPKPTRALFLAFDASPPFIDHEVFPALLSDRLDDVTIIVDELSLRASNVDAGSTRKAGILYQVCGVRPMGGGLFHPKLACLASDSGVHVLIGSANLTWSGWCRNVEIIDPLSFGPSGSTAPHAAVALAAFLDDLPPLLVGLNPESTAALRRMSGLLIEAAASMQVAPHSPSSGGIVAQVVSAVLDSSDDDSLAPAIVPPPIPDGLTPRQQLFAYIMACGAPSIRAIGTLVIRAAFAVLLLVIAAVLPGPLC